MGISKRELKGPKLPGRIGNPAKRGRRISKRELKVTSTPLSRLAKSFRISKRELKADKYLRAGGLANFFGGISKRELKEFSEDFLKFVFLTPNIESQREN